MNELDYHVLDVFTETALAGNPLAVVLGADALDEAHMLAIAREFNLSETIFVLSPTSADAVVRARIFTPGGELPFAGHPTVGLACLLSRLGVVSGDDVRFVIEENIGPVPVHVRLRPGRAPFAQLSAVQALSYGPPLPPASALAVMLGLDEAAILVEPTGPRNASCGVPFMLIPLRSLADLAAIQLDTSRWRALPAGAWARQILVYTRADSADVRMRMFAPELGIPEDPATGAAAVALAGALACESDRRDGTLHWQFEQGVEMGRPSQLFAEADKMAGEVVAVRVGGHAVHVMSGRLFL